MKKTELLAKLEAHVEYLNSVLSNYITLAKTAMRSIQAIVTDITKYSDKIQRLRISLGLTISLVDIQQHIKYQ